MPTGVHQLAEVGSCILVFLPGIAEISSVQDDLEGARSNVPLQVIVLHSLVPKEQMEAVMAEAIPGHCKVVLSTNMAESSITITDVKYIIDSGLHRDIVFDDRRGMPSLLCNWCAQASVKQRAGRAGRVAPGTVLHLFTRQFHDQFMSPFDTAEILRVPLEKTVLNVKMLLTRFGRATELIQQTITPPPRDRVSAAVKQLFEVGALSANSEDSDVTVRFPFDTFAWLPLPWALPIHLSLVHPMSEHAMRAVLFCSPA
jgi:HrpA-like RNA helicase